MTSHTYQFTPRDLARLLGWPLVPVAVFALLAHAGAGLRLLPKPRPTLDVDRTILIHQVEASRAKHDAEILLLGDSSCLMDVDARRLGEQLGRPALNLGTLSYLDLNASAALLREYAAANPGRLRAVVLLLHPEALRRVGPEAWHVNFLNRQLSGEDFIAGTGLRERLSEALGLETFRGRILSRLLPTPLPGVYGRDYGFSTDLARYLTEHHGSAADPDPRPFTGNAEYRLAASLEPASRNFRAALPPGVKLLAAITPAPAGFVGPRYAETRRQMLREWSQWLDADAALEDLPSTLPDALFAKTTHLTEAGARAFTDTLAHCLEAHLR